MKEQPAYASQEQNPFMSSVIFNFQQLYQHLQLSLPKSHMTCFQPTIDKPYGVSLKGRFCFRWRNNWAGWAGGVGWGGVKVRNNTTAPDWTTHLLFSPEELTTELIPEQVHYLWLSLGSPLIWGDNGLPQIPPSLPYVYRQTLGICSHDCLFEHVRECECVPVGGMYTVGGSKLIELFLLFQTVIEGPFEAAQTTWVAGYNGVTALQQGAWEVIIHAWALWQRWSCSN